MGKAFYWTAACDSCLLLVARLHASGNIVIAALLSQPKDCSSNYAESHSDGVPGPQRNRPDAASHFPIEKREIHPLAGHNK